MKALALALIRVYQRLLSPHKGYCCAYRVHTGRASCSGLGYRAIRRHGAWRGLAILRQRLHRCAHAHRLLSAEPPRLHAQAGFCDVAVFIGNAVIAVYGLGEGLLRLFGWARGDRSGTETNFGAETKRPTAEEKSEAAAGKMLKFFVGLLQVFMLFYVAAALLLVMFQSQINGHGDPDGMGGFVMHIGFTFLGAPWSYFLIRMGFAASETGLWIAEAAGILFNVALLWWLQSSLKKALSGQTPQERE